MCLPRQSYQHPRGEKHCGRESPNLARNLKGRRSCFHKLEGPWEVVRTVMGLPERVGMCCPSLADGKSGTSGGGIQLCRKVCISVFGAFNLHPFLVKKRNSVTPFLSQGLPRLVSLVAFLSNQTRSRAKRSGCGGASVLAGNPVPSTGSVIDSSREPVCFEFS